jgi:hypothetical protein
VLKYLESINLQCQYCGKSAPDVVLEIDHIKPVAKDGDNDIMNLITSCFDCNRGKRDKSLDDNSIVLKQKRQLEELQERREQLDMLIDWRTELSKVKDDATRKMSEFWSELVPGYSLNDVGLNNLKKLIKKFSYQEVIDAMEVATTQYIEFVDNKITKDSVELAFSKIGGICTIKRQEAENPHISDLYYIRGILRNRLNYCDDQKSLRLLQSAVDNGASIDSLKQFASTVKNWTNFQNGIFEFIEQQEKEKNE